MPTSPLACNSFDTARPHPAARRTFWLRRVRLNVDRHSQNEPALGSQDTSFGLTGAIQRKLAESCRIHRIRVGGNVGSEVEAVVLSQRLERGLGSRAEM